MGTSKEDDLRVEGFSEAFGKINKALENLQKWPFLDWTVKVLYKVKDVKFFYHIILCYHINLPQI